MSNLAQRLLVAIVGIPLLVAAILSGGYFLFAFVAAFALVATWELLRLVTPLELRAPYRVLAYAGVLFYLFDASRGGQTMPLITAAVVMASIGYAGVTYRKEAPPSGWQWAVVAALYIGLLLSHWLLLRRLPQGVEWVSLALFATFANDTAAYSVGRLLGRHTMAPDVSPGKTWEGAIGAMVATTLALPTLATLFGLPIPWHLWLLGPVLSIAAQVGDLAKSMLKRIAGVKDSSQLLPGHGGVLDRIDSSLFVGPLVYYYVLWLAALP